MIEEQSNLERLKDKGVYTADDITPEEEELVQSLTTDEVNMLIHLHEKLGPTARGRDKIRPCFPL